MRCVPVLATALAVLASVTAGLAKEIGFKSPSGRRIYSPDETFGQAIGHEQRYLVAEASIGAGPEGNLALLLGWLNQPIRKVDLYLGLGFEANPARLYTFSARHTLTFGDFRPYASLGYLLKDTHAVGLISHNVFLELGHSWVLHRTYRLAVGLGLRRILHTSVKETSLLEDSRVDPDFLDEQLDDINPWLPTLALRFSRAF